MSIALLLSNTMFISPMLPNLSDCVIITSSAVSNQSQPGTSQRVIDALRLRGVSCVATGSSSASVLFTLGSTPLPISSSDRKVSIVVSIRPPCVRHQIKCNATLAILPPLEAPRPSIVTAAYQSGQVVATIGALSVPSVSAVAQVNRISFTSVLVECEYSNEPLEFYVSPLGLNISRDSNVSFQNGTVIGNLVILLLVLGIQFAIMGFIKMRSQGQSAADGAVALLLPTCALTSMARFPSFLVIPLLFAQQSMTTAAATIFLYGSNATDYFCGVIGVAVPTITVFYTYSCVRRCQLFCTYVPNARRRSGLARFFHGNGKWIDLDKKKRFKQRHQFMFSDYTSECPWFMCVEMSMNVVCGLIQGLVYPEQCRNLLAAAVFAFLCFTIFAVVKRPYSSSWGAMASIGLCILELMGAASSWVGVYYNNSDATSVAGTMGIMCFYLLSAQALVALGPKVMAFLRLGSMLRQWWRPADFYDKDGAIICINDQPAGETTNQDAGQELCIVLRSNGKQDEHLAVADGDMLLTRDGISRDVEQPPPLRLASGAIIEDDEDGMRFLDDLLSSSPSVADNNHHPHLPSCGLTLETNSLESGGDDLMLPSSLLPTNVEHDSILMTVGLSDRRSAAPLGFQNQQRMDLYTAKKDAIIAPPPPPPPAPPSSDDESSEGAEMLVLFPLPPPVPEAERNEELVLDASSASDDGDEL